MNGDLLRRVDSLVEIHDAISALSDKGKTATPGGTDSGPSSEVEYQAEALLKQTDNLLDALSKIFNDIFSFKPDEIPIRFTKYFISIVLKTCSTKELMREASYNQVLALVEQLLTRLLIENLDKIGSPAQKEGESILRNLNSSMLRMLENCQHTHIFLVLFSLLTKYRDDPANAKVPSLIIKCLLKLSKNMEKIIEKIDLDKFLLAIHEYLVSVGNQQASSNDDLGLRIAKTLINETVRLKKESIWDHFAVVEQHPSQDQRLKKWILIILRSSDSTGVRSSVVSSTGAEQTAQAAPSTGGQSRIYVETEIKRIIQDLKDPSRRENGLARLEKFEEANPGYDYQRNLSKEGVEFCQGVMLDLNRFKRGISHNSTNPSSGLAGSTEPGNPQDNRPTSM